MEKNARGEFVGRIFPLIISLITAFSFTLSAQTGQLHIPRVTEMPDLPAPYLMRDWKTVATQYDEFIFSSTATGEYLPIISLKPNGVNYPDIQPIMLDTYVGTATENQAEAINILPAVVGATLVGIDKTNDAGTDWVTKSKDFFNLANGQNVYLNGYSSTSGSDWWYDLMPNIFFYQLYSQYPDIADFDTQFISIADRWLEAIMAMGGATTPWQVPEMNYRGWRLASMTPNNNGVVEPEAAGAIAWILYHAWIETGEKKYLAGAELSMEFLSGLESNPSYELQLPYGAFAAAKMNAELGTAYDLEKILNWCFDRGALRGWGVISGTWNGSDVSGLIGEANDAGNDYAFAMNGFQQAAALVPMVKYDKRFAHDMAKWILNLANATRLFYPQFLPPADQDDHAWSAQHDPQSVIAYEALKENWNGKDLYGTGDAKREGWAQTNLGIYGSSHVGYLGAIIESTNVEGILTLDINKTDFFGENPFQSLLVYNPHIDPKQITLPLGAGSFDIYNAISELLLQEDASGNAVVEVPADEVMILVFLPSGTATSEKDGKLYAGEKIVDYNFGYNFEGKLRIKSLSASDTLVEFNQSVLVYSTIENQTESVHYTWYVDDVISPGDAETFTWIVPETEGFYTLKLKVTSSALSSVDSLVFRVVENVPKAPVLKSFITDSTWYYAGTTASIICDMHSQTGNMFQYTWTLPGGSVKEQDDSLLVWTLPALEGLYTLSCLVTDEDGLTTTSTIDILVKEPGNGETDPFAYYPMNGNVRDYSGNARHATLDGPQPANDALGESGKAYRFTSNSDIIFLPNETALNFRDKITVAFWIKLDAITEESFVLSHGSWEERWKISVTPGKNLRWTIKNASGTQDLDSTFPLVLGTYYHFTAVYSGYSMELYVDGELDNFESNSGQLSVTSKDLTFGRKDTGTTDYSLHGSLDEVRIYDEALSPDEIKTLRSLWSNNVTGVQDEVHEAISVYPNPSGGVINISGPGILNIEVWDLKGVKIQARISGDSGLLFQVDCNPAAGMMILKIETPQGAFYKKIVKY